MQSVYVVRRSKLLKRLSSQGIEKVLVRKPHNIYYFTGIMFNPYDRFAALLLDSKNNSCSMIWSGLETGNASEQGIPEIIYWDDEDPVIRLLEALDNCTTLGVEMDLISVKFGDRLKELLPKIKLIDLTNMIENMRTYKEQTEIEIIQKAAEYGDQTFHEVRDLIQVGCSEKEVLVEIFRAMSIKPGVITDSFIIQVLSGERSALPNGESNDRRIQKGDSITVDFGVHYSHYWSDATRNFFMGKPSNKLENIYKIVLEAQTAAIEKVRPGIPIKEIDLTARDIIENAGYGQFFLHKVGHGIGLEIHENPKLNQINEDILEENMVIAVEPGIYIPQLGGVRIEDNIVVTSNGFKVLNNYPKEFKDMIME